MLKLWVDEAWDDYVWWQGQDRKTLRRINRLIRDIERCPYSGLGKPEPLRFNLAGKWSRRIDAANRLVYRVEEDRNVIFLYSCRDHYE